MNHYFCEANTCVDALVRKGSGMNCDFINFNSSLVDMNILLYYDSIEVYYEKLF